VPAPITDLQASTKKYVDDNTEATWVANDTRAKTALNATGAASIFACRAWVNFNGTGTVAIRNSGNVSSITDVGVGKYEINFITSMIDLDYSVSFGGNLSLPGTQDVSADSTCCGIINASKAFVTTQDESGGDTDFGTVTITVFR